MCDMAFGLTRQDVMRVAYSTVEKTGREHPFSNGMFGRAWLDSFRSRNPNLTIPSKNGLATTPATVLDNSDKVSQNLPVQLHAVNLNDKSYVYTPYIGENFCSFYRFSINRKSFLITQ